MRILMIDDEPMVMRYYTMALEKHGAEVTLRAPGRPREQYQNPSYYVTIRPSGYLMFPRGDRFR